MPTCRDLRLGGVVRRDVVPVAVVIVGAPLVGDGLHAPVEGDRQLFFGLNLLGWVYVYLIISICLIGSGCVVGDEKVYQYISTPPQTTN